MNNQDPYWKLRSKAPKDEICSCTTAGPIKLMSALSRNPIHCLECNLEVMPETVPVPPELVEEIASWLSVCDALDRLWLDSAEYEEFAREQLEDINSAVNLRGRCVSSRLAQSRKCFYSWFQDQGSPLWVPPTNCPLCGSAFHVFKSAWLICESCALVTARQLPW